MTPMTLPPHSHAQRRTGYLETARGKTGDRRHQPSKYERQSQWQGRKSGKRGRGGGCFNLGSSTLAPWTSTCSQNPPQRHSRSWTNWRLRVKARRSGRISKLIICATRHYKRRHKMGSFPSHAFVGESRGISVPTHTLKRMRVRLESIRLCTRSSAHTHTLRCWRRRAFGSVEESHLPKVS